MSTPNPGGQAIRLDTDHTIQDLMTAAVSRISSDIRVAFRERQVHLTGSTQSWYEKQLAQESLRTVSRSVVIYNDISVTGWNDRECHASVPASDSFGQQIPWRPRGRV